jgi:hypothetical protein
MHLRAFAFLCYNILLNGEVMQKIVINRCFGGFGLSEQAFELLLARKNIEFDKVVDAERSFANTSYYKSGSPHSDATYISEYEFYEQRNDPDLIAVVEQLGESANGWAADLVIVEIPAGVNWHVAEYDGLEHIAENHRTWYDN